MVTLNELKSLAKAMHDINTVTYWLEQHHELYREKEDEDSQMYRYIPRKGNDILLPTNLSLKNIDDIVPNFTIMEENLRDKLTNVRDTAIRLIETLENAKKAMAPLLVEDALEEK